MSYQNVCKRISQARGILREELRGYFIEEDGTDTDKSVPQAAAESAIGEMSEGNAPVEADAGETVTLPEAVEEVESVVGEEAQEVVRDVQHSEPVMVAATNDGKLEVKSDGCRWVEAALGELLLAPILALAQFDEETGRWGNSYLAVLRRQQQSEVGKVAGEFLRSFRSPPTDNFLFTTFFVFWRCILIKCISGIKMKVRWLAMSLNDSRTIISQLPIAASRREGYVL